ncbi:MAG: selenide, water dikinase SelD [Myxococcaceae bacterium]|jgi:selenide,water dikinase|nr:selenide, water dikinase SelD [Myxococcaceae bacterium]MCA3015982.1 selenide, water dikinase SelD [Myxococcaceae bacterium]
MNAPLPRLTQLSNCAGCAAKLRPDLLQKVLRGLASGPRPKDALVGFETSDDAAVYRLRPDLAVVETVDFFPPVLDDPYAYGQIAAANAMSDIWAMGAKALFALNLVAFPKELPTSMLRALLAGGASKAKEAGIPILGGHSVQSPEPKYGMAVTGVVHPKKVLTNAGGRAGDVLLLTKPIGTGIATTALKRGLASKALVRRVTAQMATLNQAAGEVFASGRFRVHALTDVTGFGLLGHGLEVALGGRLRAVVELERVPLLPEVAALAEQGVVPGGTKTNLAHASKKVRFPTGLPEAVKHVLADAQTNGGLLAAVPERDAPKALRALEARGVEAWLVGWLEAGRPGLTVR